MDAFNKVVQIPSWAYDFCYYYLAVAVIVAIYSTWALVKLLMLPNIVKKFVPTTMMAIALILSGGVSVLLTLMQFWICRGALAPSAKPAPPAGGGGIVVRATEGFAAHNGKKEGFAVKCATTGDCEAVMGTPQGSDCTCGARGFCGGCKMRNNMEPQPSFSAAFDSDYAPMGSIEGFSGKPYY